MIATQFPTTAHSWILLTQCAWCGAFKFRRLAIKLPLVGRLRLDTRLLGISHGVCEPCMRQMLTTSGYDPARTVD